MKFLNMLRIAVLAVVGIFASDEASAALSCTSSLRFQFPHLFKHCSQSCVYGPWSSWTYDSYVHYYQHLGCTNNNNRAARYNRTRVALTTTCSSQNTYEYKYQCEPNLGDKVHIFVKELGLGGDAAQYDTNEDTRKRRNVADTITSKSRVTRHHQGIGNVGIPSFQKCPATAAAQYPNRICRGMCTSRKKREVQSEAKAREIINIEGPAEQFDVEAYLERSSRRKRQSCSTKRYVLFVLDNSGSIPKSDFTEIRNMLANISSKLCGNINVAMITYEQYINLEFCFNCHSSRADIAAAIQRTEYVGGPRTQTYHAIKCLNSYILGSECNLPSGNPEVDVILITDGKHNGECSDDNLIGAQARILHSRSNTNTYAIAIGNAAQDQVRALEEASSNRDRHIFNVENMQEMREFMIILDEYINQRNAYGYVNTCAHVRSDCWTWGLIPTLLDT